ncbi:MAG: methylated-DNA--[protein]-cysteine S-methyltransferase [Firmicutes bacterium]|nr:methylated-DNA--[protein]-cysteine S-methyltransferase [Bacillota bacterium]
MAGGLHEAAVRLAVARTDSFWGEVSVAWTERGVAGVSWAADEAAMVTEALARLRRAGRGEAVVERAAAWPEERLPGLRAALRRGEAWPGPYDEDGAPPFYRAVWAACRRIPRGEVRTYAWLAQEAGRPRAARAAGGAMAANPFLLITPCHRVLPAGGQPGNYGGGGPEVKTRLLALEGALPALSGLRPAASAYGH